MVASSSASQVRMQTERSWRSGKLWAQAKIATKDLTSKQKGPWVFTLLDGLALEAVEHLTIEQLTEYGGDSHSWSALEERFPDKLKHDHLAECLQEVFQLAAKEGENMPPGALLEVSKEGQRRLSVRSQGVGSPASVRSQRRPASSSHRSCRRRAEV